MLAKGDMPNDPVKYLNETCNVRVGARVSAHHFELGTCDVVEQHAKVMLAEQLGHSLLERMSVATRDDPRTHERVYTAEAYVLTPVQAQVLWRMMKDAARRECLDTKPEREITQLKDAVELLEQQLEEAKEAAAGADKTAEGRHRACQALELVVDEKRKKIRKLEQTIQTQQNTISSMEGETIRLRKELSQANARNDNQSRTIDRLAKRVSKLSGQHGMAMPAVLEAIDALLEDGGGFCGVWDPDVANFADALKARLRGDDDGHEPV